MTTHKIKHGDSYWLDIAGDTTTINPTWPGTWSGKWNIAPSIGGTPVASGTLILFDGVQATPSVTGKFRLQLSTTDSASIAAGSYYLTIQIDNTASDYRKEIAQDKFIVSAEGITP